uniref:Uncharacterized protein n=1 Tax=Vannella robusta TaxID=1487602 RepID=A0A7S4IKM9_9EUKA
MGLGLSLVYLHPFLTLWECLAAAAPIGLTLSTWIGVLFKSTLFRSVPGLPPSIGIVTCLLQIVISIMCFVKKSQCWSRNHTKIAKAQLLHFSLSFLPLVFLSFWLAMIHYTHSLLEEGGKYHVGGSVYGDLPFHLTIITSILHGVNQYATPLTSGLQAAFFADSPLVYPWIPDYHAALVAGSGSTFHFALCYPGIMLTSSFFFLLFFLYFRMTQSRRIALMSVPITFFAGGIGGFLWLLYDGTWKTLLAEDHVLVNSLSRTIEFYWFSLPAHILFPQRTTQFAYSISLLVLIVIHKAYTSKPSPVTVFHRKSSLVIDDDLKGKNGAPKEHFTMGAVPNEHDTLKLFGAAGFICGLLPLLQVHSFAAVGLVILTVAFIHVVKIGGTVVKSMRTNSNLSWAFQIAKGHQLKWWLVFGIASWGIGMPQNLAFFMKVLFPTHRPSARSFLRFMLISSDFPPQGNIILLWLQALGFYVPLYLAD